MESHQYKLHLLAEEARQTKQPCITILPSLYGKGSTRWTAKPTVLKEGIAVDISFEILKNN